ncbi:hypothetical protein BLNAU_3096 [Blattamonas nauphoetae]|uniref:Uncharacterized protein n=1 Tax=Blattamonas nauphoetae TaxID=2049346 RepID=A0ABQ9YEA0_9EUKA|nr:hypothetical protein BLNAU_3096 [Blattamonas nauphoetae]
MSSPNTPLDIKTSLSSCYFTNLTSNSQPTTPERLPNFVEFAVGVELRSVWNSLYGTITSKLGRQSEFLLQNSSLLECVNEDEETTKSYDSIPEITSSAQRIGHGSEFTHYAFTGCTIKATNMTAYFSLITLNPLSGNVEFVGCSFEVESNTQHNTLISATAVRDNKVKCQIDTCTFKFWRVIETSGTYNQISLSNFQEISVVSSTFSPPSSKFSQARALATSSPVSFLFFSNTSFTRLTSTGGGGALLLPYSLIRFFHCHFEGNKASNGGAFYTSSCCHYLCLCTFTRNEATNRGGAVYSSYLSRLRMFDCHFDQNQAFLKYENDPTKLAHYRGNDIFAYSPSSNGMDDTTVFGCTSTSETPKYGFYVSTTQNGYHPNEDILLPSPSGSPFSNVFFVEAGESGTCSEGDPCGSLGAALSQLSTDPSLINLGNGIFEEGSLDISKRVELRGLGFFVNTSTFTTLKTSCVVSGGGNVTLMSLSLKPTDPSSTILTMQSTNQSFLSNVKIECISGHLTPLLSFSSGISTVHSSWLSSIEMQNHAVIEITGSATVTFHAAWFMEITRLNGNGGSCIDSQTSEVISFTQTNMAHCSSSGRAGCLDLTASSSTSQVVVESILFTTNTANSSLPHFGNDIAHTGFVPSNISTLSSCRSLSTLNHILINETSKSNLVCANRFFTPYGIDHPFATDFEQGVPLSWFRGFQEEIDLLMESTIEVQLRLSGTQPFTPFEVVKKSVLIRTCTLKLQEYTKRLAYVGQAGSLGFFEVPISLAGTFTVTPFVVAPTAIRLYFLTLSITMSVSQQNVPFVQCNGGILRFDTVTFSTPSGLNLAGCSLLECSATSIEFLRSLIENVTSNQDGAVFYATNCSFKSEGSSFKKCRARNGGAVAIELSGSKTILITHAPTSSFATTFSECAAVGDSSGTSNSLGRGGALFVSGTSTHSRPILFYSSSFNHARFEGNIADLGMDLFITSDLFEGKDILDIAPFGGGSMSADDHVAIEGHPSSDSELIGLLIPTPTVSVNGSVYEVMTGMSGQDSEECKWTSSFCATLGYGIKHLTKKYASGELFPQSIQFVWNMTYTEKAVVVYDQDVSVSGTTTTNAQTADNNAKLSVSGLDLRPIAKCGLFDLEADGDCLIVSDVGMVCSDGTRYLKPLIKSSGRPVSIDSCTFNTSNGGPATLTQPLLQLVPPSADVVPSAAITLRSVCISSFQSTRMIVEIDTDGPISVLNTLFSSCSCSSEMKGRLILVKTSKLDESITKERWSGSVVEGVEPSWFYGQDRSLPSTSDLFELSLLLMLGDGPSDTLHVSPTTHSSPHINCGSSALPCSTFEASLRSSTNHSINNIVLAQSSLLESLFVSESSLTIRSQTQKHVLTLQSSAQLGVDDDSTVLLLSSLEMPIDPTCSSSSVFLVSKGEMHLSSSQIGANSLTLLNSDLTTLFEVLGEGTLRLTDSTIRNVQFTHPDKGTAIHLNKGATFITDSSSIFEAISSNGTGSLVFVCSDSLSQTATTSPHLDFNSTIPLPTNTIFSETDKNRFIGREGSEEWSLLYFWHPHTSGPVHINTAGQDHPNCGTESLPCFTLSQAFSNVKGQNQRVSVQSDVVMTEVCIVHSTGLSISSDSFPFTVKIQRTAQFSIQSSTSLSVKTLHFHIEHATNQPLFLIKEGTLTLISDVSFSHSLDYSMYPFTNGLFSSSSGTVSVVGTDMNFKSVFNLEKSYVVEQHKGKLSVTQSDFSNVENSLGDGSVIHSSLASASDSLQIVECSFTACRSSGNGGAISIECSKSVRSSSLVVSASFSQCACGSEGLGQWVYLSGHSFSSLLSVKHWTATIAGLETPNDDALLWGEDSAQSESSALRSVSLLHYLLGGSFSERLFANGESHEVEGGCGESEETACRTVEQTFQQKVSSSVEIVIVKSSTLSEALFLLSSSLSLTSPSGSSGKSTLEVNGNGIDNSRGVISCSSHSTLALSALRLTSLSSSPNTRFLVSASSSLVSVTSCEVLKVVNGIGVVEMVGESTLTVSDCSLVSSSFVSTPISVLGGTDHSVLHIDFVDVSVPSSIVEFVGFSSDVRSLFVRFDSRHTRPAEYNDDQSFRIVDSSGDGCGMEWETACCDSTKDGDDWMSGSVPPDLTSPYSQSSQQHHRNLNSVVSNELSITRHAPSPPSLSLDGVYKVSEMLLSNTEMTLIGSPSCQFVTCDTSANSPHLFRLTNTTLSIRSIKFDLAKDLSCSSNVEQTTHTHQPSIASLTGSTLSTDNCSFVFVGGGSLFVLSSPTTPTAETANHLTIKNCRLDLIAQIITPLCTVQDSIQPLSSHSVVFVGNTLSSLQVHSNTGFLFANANEHSPQICSTISDTFLTNISRSDEASLPRVSPMTIAERVVKSHIEDALDIFAGSLFAPLESQHAFSCINTSFTQCINADTHQHNPSNYTFVGQTYDATVASNRFSYTTLANPIHFIECDITSVNPTASDNFLYLYNNTDDITIRSCSFTANVTSSIFTRFLRIVPLAGAFPTLTIDDLTCLYGVANNATSDDNIIYVLSSMNVILTASTFTSPTDRSNTRSLRVVAGIYLVHVFGCVFSDANVEGSGGAIFQSHGGDLNVADCLFENNKVSGFGGSVQVGSQCVSFHRCVFEQNTAKRGGAMTGASMTMTVLEDCLFEGNTATEGQHFSGNDIMTQSLTSVFSGSLVVGCTSTSSAPKISFYSSALVNGMDPKAEILLPDPSTKTDYEHKLSVAVDGSGSTCSEALPCQTLADALLTISTTGRNRVLIGTGTFSDGTRTVSGSVELVGNGWVRDSSFFTTVMSGGMKVGSGGNVTLRSMTLLPSTATTIIVGMSEDGVLRLSFVQIDQISSHSSSLISISKGTTTLFRCWFDKVNLTSSAFVSVSGSASLNMLGTYFMLITRTSGEGASCIDSESTGRIELDSSDFGNCSSSGVAGALHLKGTTTSASLSFNQVYFFDNEAKNDSTATDGTILKAHDVVVEDFSSNTITTSALNSFSTQISYLRLGVATRLSPVTNFGYASNGISFPLAGKYYQGLPLAKFSSIKEMTEQTFKYCSTVSPLLTGLTLPVEPLFAEDVYVRWRGLTIVASTSSETLVTIGMNATLQFVEKTFVFNAIPTVTPFIVQHSSGQFVLQDEIIQMNCTVTPLTVPLFSVSAGTVRLSEVTLPILSFHGCAMIEGTGGTIRLARAKFTQITSTGNGSVVHATSTVVSSDSCSFDRCQSKNGGAIWFEATGTNSLQVIHPSSSTYSTTFEGCEAAERGGAICVEGSSSISNPIRFFTDKINHARFSGNKATMSGNDVFVGKSVFGSKTISEIGSFGGGSLSDWFHVVIEELAKTEEEKVDIGLLIPLPTVSVNGSVNELTTGMSGTDSEACKWTSTFCATLGYAMSTLRSKQDGKYIEMKTQFVWNMTYTELPMNVSDQSVKLTGTTASDQTKCNVTRTIVEMDSKSAAGSALFTIEKGAVFSVSNMDLKIREGHGLIVVASTGDSLRIENCGMIASSGSTLSESVICVNGGSLELLSSLLNTTELPSCSPSEALISVNSASANILIDTVLICGFSFSSSSLVHLATETSMTVKHVTFERCMRSLGTGHLVLVEGTNLQNQISPANWEGTFSETTPMDSLWGKDSTLSSSPEWNEASLLFYLFRPDGKIVAGGTGSKASTHPFCGSEQLICSTLESAHTSLRDGLNTVWIESDISLMSNLGVAKSATLTSSTSTKRVLWLTESGMIEVDETGITVTMKSLPVCFDSSSISPTLFSVKCGTLDVDECVIGGSSSENALVLSSFVTSLISVGQAGIVDLGSSKISNVVFGHSSEGSAIVMEKGGSLVLDSSESVSSIRSNGTGSHLLMFGDSFASIAASAEMTKLKPKIPETRFFSLEERKKLAGSVNGVVESILYEWFARASGVVHVRREGVDAVKGGHACLPQQTLSFCLTQLVSGGKIVIDSAFSLAEGLEQPNSEITISANPMKNEEIGVEVEVVGQGSFSISHGHLTVSSVSFSTAVKARPFMRVSDAGSLSIASCSFSGFSSASSGSVVSASLGEANALSITSSQFSNCKSDLSGGVIHLLLSSATESSQIVMKGTFSECSCGNGKKGDWVFVEGAHLENQIDPQNWSGHPTLFGKVNENRMWGTDSSESSPIFSSSTLLVYLVETKLNEVFVSSLGRDARGCGLDRLPCKTISSSMSHLLNSTTSQISLQTASTLTGEVVNSWNHLIVCGDEQSSKDVLVSLSGHISVPIHELSLSFISFDTNEGCFATSLISLSGRGSLSVDSCSFRSFHSSSSGSIVCGTVSSSSFLSLTASSFSSCKSDGDGGVIWVRCEESVESSSLVVNCSFDSSCESAGLGQWVYLSGHSFSSLLSAKHWTATIAGLETPNDDALLWGEDNAQPESSALRSVSLLHYLLGGSFSERLFANGESHEVSEGGCGESEETACRTVEQTFQQKVSSSLEIVIVKSSSLSEALFLMSSSLSLTSPSGSSGKSELEVNGNKVDNSRGVISCSSHSTLALSALRLTSLSSSPNTRFLVSASSSLVSVTSCEVLKVVNGIGVVEMVGESTLTVSDCTLASSSFVPTPISVLGGTDHSVLHIDFVDVSVPSSIVEFVGFSSGLKMDGVKLRNISFSSSSTSSAIAISLNSSHHDSSSHVIVFENCCFDSDLSSPKIFALFSFDSIHATLVLQNTTMITRSGSSTQAGMVVEWSGRQPVVIRRKMETTGCVFEVRKR